MGISDEVRARLIGAKPGASASGKLKQQKMSREELSAKLNHQPHPDVIDEAGLEPTGDPEKDAKAEMNALKQGLSGQISSWKEKFAQLNDSEYWFAVYFRDNATKDRFLQRAGLFEHGDKYIDGRVMAEAFDIDMTEPE